MGTPLLPSLPVRYTADLYVTVDLTMQLSRPERPGFDPGLSYQISRDLILICPLVWAGSAAPDRLSLEIHRVKVGG